MENQNEQRIRTIGVIIDCLHESYQSTIWKGLTRAAEEQNVTLISFVATSQDRTSHFHVHYPVVRDFAAAADLDGLIVFTGSIAEHHGGAFVEELMSCFRHVPTICISTPIPGFPSVSVDNRHGIMTLIDHLVEIHNLSRIAFVKGPEGHMEAEERFAAYRDGLRKNGLPLLDELVLPGDFSLSSGQNAVSQLLDNGIEVNAIIAADDKAAFGVISELKKRKTHIPTGVAVAGFDDVAEAAVSLPSLTTVQQPLSQMGSVALEQLLCRLEGRPTEASVRLPAMPVYRRSCGCFSDIIRGSGASAAGTSRLDKEGVLENLMQVAQPHLNREHRLFPGDDSIRQGLEDLYESLIWDVQKPSIREIFLNEVDMLLFRFEEYADNVALMNRVLDQLGVYLSSVFQDPDQMALAGTVLQQGQTLVREHRLNFAETTFLQDTLFQLMIRETSQSIITTFEQRKLLQAISSSFPSLNIQSLVFAIYDRKAGEEPMTDDSWRFPEKSMLLLGYDNVSEKVMYPRGGVVFPSRDLFPPDLMSRQRRAGYIFMPLFFEEEQLGFTIFEYAGAIPMFMFEELRLHMSSALKSSFLMKDLRVQSMLDELTGLHNRRGFLLEGKRLFRQWKKDEQDIYLFYADMDDLKIINDTFGHKEGDKAICAAAEVLRRIFREGDVVARIGGDEFVALVICSRETTDMQGIIQNRLQQQLSGLNAPADRPYRLSLSMGIATSRDLQNVDLETLMREADERLMAKKRIKNIGRLKAGSVDLVQK